MEESNIDATVVPNRSEVFDASAYANSEEVMSRIDKLTDDCIVIDRLRRHLNQTAQQFHISYDLCLKNAEGQRSAEKTVEQLQASYNTLLARSNELSERINDIHALIRECVESGDIDTDTEFVRNMQVNYGLKLSKKMEVKVNVTGYVLIELTDVPHDWELQDVEDTISNQIQWDFCPNMPSWIGDNDEVSVDIYDHDVELDSVEEMR